MVKVHSVVRSMSGWCKLWCGSPGRQGLAQIYRGKKVLHPLDGSQCPEKALVETGKFVCEAF